MARCGLSPREANHLRGCGGSSSFCQANLPKYKNSVNKDSTIPHNIYLFISLFIEVIELESKLCHIPLKSIDWGSTRQKRTTNSMLVFTLCVSCRCSKD